MAAQGYIRIDNTTFLNITTEEDKDRFFRILNSRGISGEIRKEKYYFDDLLYQWVYAYSISFESTVEQLNQIMDEFNRGKDAGNDNISGNDTP